MQISNRGTARVHSVMRYIDDMERERQGWGDEPLQDVHETRASFLRAMDMMFRATEVWADGTGDSLSFGGVMPGGITFGIIARVKPMPDDRFALPPVEWTFHS